MITEKLKTHGKDIDALKQHHGVNIAYLPRDPSNSKDFARVKGNVSVIEDKSEGLSLREDEDIRIVVRGHSSVKATGYIVVKKLLRGDSWTEDELWSTDGSGSLDNSDVVAGNYSQLYTPVSTGCYLKGTDNNTSSHSWIGRQFSLSGNKLRVQAYIKAEQTLQGAHKFTVAQNNNPVVSSSNTGLQIDFILPPNDIDGNDKVLKVDDQDTSNQAWISRTADLTENYPLTFYARVYIDSMPNDNDGQLVFRICEDDSVTSGLIGKIGIRNRDRHLILGWRRNGSPNSEDTGMAISLQTWYTFMIKLVDSSTVEFKVMNKDMTSTILDETKTIDEISASSLYVIIQAGAIAHGVSYWDKVEYRDSNGVIWSEPFENLDNWLDHSTSQANFSVYSLESPESRTLRITYLKGTEVTQTYLTQKYDYGTWYWIDISIDLNNASFQINVYDETQTNLIESLSDTSVTFYSLSWIVLGLGAVATGQAFWDGIDVYDIDNSTRIWHEGFEDENWSSNWNLDNIASNTSFDRVCDATAPEGTGGNSEVNIWRETSSTWNLMGMEEICFYAKTNGSFTVILQDDTDLTITSTSKSAPNGWDDWSLICFKKYDFPNTSFHWNSVKRINIKLSASNNLGFKIDGFVIRFWSPNDEDRWTESTDGWNWSNGTLSTSSERLYGNYSLYLSAGGDMVAEKEIDVSCWISDSITVGMFLKGSANYFYVELETPSTTYSFDFSSFLHSYWTYAYISLKDEANIDDKISKLRLKTDGEVYVDLLAVYNLPHEIVFADNVKDKIASWVALGNTNRFKVLEYSSQFEELTYQLRGDGLAVAEVSLNISGDNVDYVWILDENAEMLMRYDVPLQLNGDGFGFDARVILIVRDTVNAKETAKDFIVNHMANSETEDYLKYLAVWNGTTKIDEKQVTFTPSGNKVIGETELSFSSIDSITANNLSVSDKSNAYFSSSGQRGKSDEVIAVIHYEIEIL